MTTTTDYIQFERGLDDPYDATAVPIYQTATFGQSSLDGTDEFDYSRSGNPTRGVLERQLARLEHADHAFAFTSGMAALSALLRVCRAGDEILVGDEIYGGTFRLLSRIAPGLGLSARAVDVTDLDAVEAAITERTRLLLVESPGNPTLRICDLQALASIATEHGVIFAVDNTMLSPRLQNPLDHGADLVVHSATKHLNGHGDVTAGAIATRRADLAETIAFVQNAEGAALNPMDCWLLLRGLATLPLRLEAQQRSARVIATWLEDRADIPAVHYPTLRSHPGREIQLRGARGGGCVISFRTGDASRARRVVEGTRRFRTTVSFGSLASSISLPQCMSHACVHAGAALSTRSVPDDLVRLSIGIEAVGDLLEDLDRALASGVPVATGGVLSGSL